jgi:hypothetical protein
MPNEETKVRILSVDAYKDDGSWQWNTWYEAATITVEQFLGLKNNRTTLRLLRDDLELLTIASIGKVRVSDDGYNVVIEARNGRPLLAIEYGAVEELR